MDPKRQLDFGAASAAKPEAGKAAAEHPAETEGKAVDPSATSRREEILLADFVRSSWKDLDLILTIKFFGVELVFSSIHKHRECSLGAYQAEAYKSLFLFTLADLLSMSSVDLNCLALPSHRLCSHSGQGQCSTRV